jgi:hypothetical protein
VSRLSPPEPPGGTEPSPGPNPLFWGTVGAIALGAIAAVSAGGEHKVAESNLVYRLIVGGIVLAIGYSVVAILWYAWHRKTLQRLGVGPASGEAPHQREEVTKRDEEIQEFMETTTDAVADLEIRLTEQEKDADASKRQGRE